MSHWLRRMVDAAPPLEITEDVRCRFGCRDSSVGLFHVPDGCICWKDPVQALCIHHALRAQSEGPITMIAKWVDKQEVLVNIKPHETAPYIPLESTDGNSPSGILQASE